MKVSLYEDMARRILVESREFFANRRDRLHIRYRYPLQGKLVESFLPGHSFGLRELTEIGGRKREFCFYVSARQDSLIRREDDIGRKIVERFVGRSDKLAYRSASLSRDCGLTRATRPLYTLPTSEAADLMVEKMSQKFIQTLGSNAADHVAKRTYFVQQGRIRTLMHRNSWHITRRNWLHAKTESCPSVHEKFLPEDCHARSGMRVNAEAPSALLTAERDCLTDIRRAQLEMLELLNFRHREEIGILTDDHLEKLSSPRCQVNGEDMEQRTNTDRCTDYLTPFLGDTAVATCATALESQTARDKCLICLKERLIERANIIMMRLNEENSKLAKKQATYVLCPACHWLSSCEQIPTKSTGQPGS